MGKIDVCILLICICLIYIGFGIAKIRRNLLGIHLQSTWMSDCHEKLRNMSLNRIAIPGSHNSGTYCTIGKKIAGDCDPKLIPYIKRVPGIASFVGRWAKCQQHSIKDQLQAGIRYLDIRLYANSSEIWLCHSLCSITLDDCLSQLRTFLDLHPQELVIFDVNHVYLSESLLHMKIVNEIIDAIGRHRIASSDTTSPFTTLKEFQRLQVQLVLIYHHMETAAQHNIWDGTKIEAPWPNVSSKVLVFDYAMNALRTRSNESSSSRIHVLQLLPTAKGTDIITHWSLIRFSRPILRAAPQLLDGLHMSSPSLTNQVNVVMIDDCIFNQNALVKAVLRLNERKIIEIAHAT